MAAGVDKVNQPDLAAVSEHGIQTGFFAVCERQIKSFNALRLAGHLLPAQSLGGEGLATARGKPQQQEPSDQNGRAGGKGFEQACGLRNLI